VAAGGSAIALTAAVRLGAARFFLITLIALARPRVAFFTGGDLPRRVAVLRRAGAVLRFVVDPRLPAFLVLVVFAFDFRAVLAMTSPLGEMIRYSVASLWFLKCISPSCP
jgi:hypothetical protein